MSVIQPKITSQAKKKENTIQNTEKKSNQCGPRNNIDVNISNKNIKIVTVTVLLISKKPNKYCRC